MAINGTHSFKYCDIYPFFPKVPLPNCLIHITQIKLAPDLPVTTKLQICLAVKLYLDKSSLYFEKNATLTGKVRALISLLGQFNSLPCNKISFLLFQ
jgi:hypothetical protein